MQQIQPILKVVAPRVVVENPVADRASCPKPIAVPTGFLVAALRHGNSVPGRELLDAPGELDHRPTHGETAGNGDVSRIPRAVVQVDAGVGNGPDMYAIEYNSDPGRPTDCGAGETMKKEVRVGDFAGER